VGHPDIYEFRLVADIDGPPISVENWQTLWSLIVHDLERLAMTTLHVEVTVREPTD
jgi:hypothetical protein